MKTRLSITLVALLLSGALTAQKSKITSAYNYLKYKDYAKAKTAIDMATENETTKDFWKTWLYRARVYSAIANQPDSQWVAIRGESVIDAYNSYQKFFTYEQNKEDVNKIKMTEIPNLIGAAFNSASAAYQAGDYAGAVKYFSLSNDVHQILGKTDTVSLYNAGLASEQSGNFDEAEKYYRLCIDAGYRAENVYGDMAMMYKRVNNVDKSLEILKEGRTKYPSNSRMLLTELEIYLGTNRFDEALKNLELAIKDDPNNHIFYFARGMIYNNKSMFEQSKENYLKAIELNPDHYDSNFNLGALYFNQGAEMITKAGDIADFDEYEKAKKAGDAVIIKAIPYLEKALEIKPNDREAMTSLMQLYGRTNQQDKYQEMKSRMEGGQ